MINTSFMKFCGIDYGSKLAGTTVAVFFEVETQKIELFAVTKNKDADAWLLALFEEQKPNFIFLDAPLSLPAVYCDKSLNTDYFYRKSDKLLKAMSPMFLGGLTARAMRLAHFLQQKGIAVYETYPAAQAKRLALKPQKYKQDKAYIPEILAQMSVFYPFLASIHNLQTWHEIDALLALIGAYRFFKEEAEFYGDKKEGGIWL